MQVYAFAAEIDRAQRTEATSGGIRAKARAGQILGSSVKPKFGYVWVTETAGGKTRKVAYAPDPATALTIRRIFRDVLVSMPLRRTATRLNAEGIPSPAGGVWRHQSLRAIVVDPAYAGEGRALDVISESGPLAAGALGEAMVELKPATITGLVDRLERKGYARRIRDASDKRRVLIEAVADRRTGLRQVLNEYVRSLMERYGSFSDDDSEVILRFLRRMIDTQRQNAVRIGAGESRESPGSRSDD